MSDWEKSYEELKAFIVRSPGIELRPNVICIPSDVREEFYRLFDKVRLSIIEVEFPQMLERGQIISKECNAIINKAIDAFKLQGIEADQGTNWFLQNPADGLFRLLFDPLFDVIRGKTDFAAFEKAVPKIIQEGFSRFVRDGYHAWTTLSLLGLMDTDKVYTTKKSQLDEDPALHIEMTVQGLMENVPEVEEAKTISFKQSLKFSFLIPNVIGHSQKLDSFIAFVPDFESNEAKWIGRNLDVQRQWIKLNDIYGKLGQADLWPDIAIYKGSSRKNVSVAADNVSVGRPDIILELRADKGWYEKEGLELIRRHYDVLDPILGSFVICLDEVPEAAREELAPKADIKPVPEEPAVEKMETAKVPTNVAGLTPEALPAVPPPPNIHLLSVGFDVQKLGPILEALLGTIAEGGEKVSPAPVLETSDDSASK